MGAFIDNYEKVTKKDFLDSNNVKFIVSGKNLMGSHDINAL